MDKFRTILKYPGAKWRIAEWIISKMPEHHSYVEPYFGSGAVFFRKQPSHIETINDIDGDIVNLFDCIRVDAEKLALLIMNTPYSREEYYRAVLKVKTETDNFERARCYLIQHWQGHGFRTYCSSGWKNDINGRERAYAVRYWNELPEWIVEIVARLKDAQIENREALDVIQRFNKENVLIYADPPYLLETRKMKRQYRYEMNDSQHYDLLCALNAHCGPAMISGYESSMYNSLLKDWDKYSIGTTSEKGLKRTEILWIKKG